MRMVDAWRGGDVLRSLVRSWKPAQQSAGIDLENLGDLEDVVQREVALCPRHLADVAPVPAGVPVVRCARILWVLEPRGELVSICCDQLGEGPLTRRRRTRAC